MSMMLKPLSKANPQPWKNGGGVTRELFTWPTSDDWMLRISVADIVSDGPFSAFPGIDRWFVVLEGNGVLLGDSAAPQTITTATLPFQFDGAMAPACSLIDGATRDLNVMIDRAKASGYLWRADQLMLDEGVYRWQPGDLAGQAIVVAVFSKQDVRLKIGDQEAAILPAYTLLVQSYTTEQASQDWLLDVTDPAQCWLLAIREHHQDRSVK